MGPVTGSNQQSCRKEGRKGGQRRKRDKEVTKRGLARLFDEDRNSTTGRRSGMRGGGGISLYYQRCFHGQVHLRAPTPPRRKKARALYIMIRHFGITTKRTGAPRPPREEFYIWNTSTRGKKETSTASRALLSSLSLFLFLSPSLVFLAGWRKNNNRVGRPRCLLFL